MTVNKSGDKAVPGIMVQDAERRIRDDDFAVNNNDGISLTAQSQDALVDDAKLTGLYHFGFLCVLLCQYQNLLSEIVTFI